MGSLFLQCSQNYMFIPHSYVSIMYSLGVDFKYLWEV